MRKHLLFYLILAFISLNLLAKENSKFFNKGEKIHSKTEIEGFVFNLFKKEKNHGRFVFVNQAFRPETKLKPLTKRKVTNLNDSGLGSLRNAITTANGGDTVYFDPVLISSGNTTLPLETEIIIDKPLILKGLYNSTDTLFISGQKKCRIFNINIANSTIKKIFLDSLVLINGLADYGGAISNTSSYSDTLNIENCIFKFNKSNIDGGALFSTNFFLFLKNCNFYGNESLRHGGAVNSHNDVKVNNSIFKKNKALNNGGGIYCFESDGILNSIFEGNTSGSNGGGIFCDILNNVKNTIIINNTATGNGGGICSLSIYEIGNSTISNNSASNGGGIFCDTGAFLLFNSTFSFNFAKLDGGGVYLTDTSKFLNCTLNNNKALENGGGVFLKQSLTVNVINSTIFENNAKYGGAIYGRLNFSNYLSILNSTIYKNTAEMVGGIRSGIIYISSSILGLNSDKNFEVGSFNTVPIPPFTSNGYNIFSDQPENTLTTDQVNITEMQLNLLPLANNGGVTQTLLPGIGSVAINKGNSSDTSSAQNGQIVGTRDVGAAENKFGSILPLDLLSFNAKATSNNNVNLFWTTTNEVFLSHFDVERSLDGHKFEKIGQVNCLGSDIKSKTNQYNFSEKVNPNLNNQAYYRLKMVDQDGQSNYTDIRVVYLNNENLRVYPNPVKDVLTLESSKKELSIMVYDFRGKQLINQKIYNPNGIKNVDLSKLKTGNYLINVDNGVKTQTFRILKE